MFNIAEIYRIPKIGTLVACYSDKWDNMSKEDIVNEIKDIKTIDVGTKQLKVLDYSIDMPFSGGKSATFKIEDDDGLSELVFPVTVSATSV